MDDVVDRGFVRAPAGWLLIEEGNIRAKHPISSGVIGNLSFNESAFLSLWMG